MNRTIRHPFTQPAAAAILLTVFASCASAPKPAQVGFAPLEAINPPNVESEFARDQLRVSKAKIVKPLATPKALLPGSASMTVQFKYNSSTFRPTAHQKDVLSSILYPSGQQIRKIEVRGRTSGDRPTSGNESVALNRALAAKSYLLAQGVPAHLISVNYVAAGDHISSNNSKRGRSLNQRVDIKVIYQ